MRLQQPRPDTEFPLSVSESIGSKLRACVSACAGGPDQIRPLLSELAAEAEAENFSLAEALQRLVSLVEVWDCLSAESSRTGDDPGSFLAEALGRLADRDGECWQETQHWIETESIRRWGTYLTLLDPLQQPLSLEEPSGEVPSEGAQDQGPSIDASLLLRMLGQVAFESPSASPKEQPAVESGSVVPRQASWLLSDPVAPEQFGEPMGPDRGPTTPSARDNGRDWPEVVVPEIDPQLRDVFLEEAGEIFERLQSLVLELGGDRDPERLRDLARCLHTLKGASLSVGLKDLGTTTHVAEDRLETSGGKVDEELVAYLEGVLGEIERTLDQLRRGGASNDRPSASVAGIDPEPTLLPAPAAGRGAIESARAAAPAPEPAHLVRDPDGTLRVPAARIDELMDLVSELLLRRRCWHELGEHLKRWATTVHTGSQRLHASLDTLLTRGSESPTLLPQAVLHLNEQAEDLAVLGETARSLIVPATDEAESLARLGLQMWETLQSVRIVPVKGLFQRLVRVARDAARVEGKSVEVETIGDEIGLDRSTQDRAFEPLLHLVRNAVGHGIETEQERLRQGKAAKGRIVLRARREGNTVLIQVEDDGRGLDHRRIESKARALGLLGPHERPNLDQLHALIFHPGFSTRDQANEVAGRGIGMDVVAREVGRLHGSVDLTSRVGQGTCFTIRLPARLALEQSVVFRLDGQPFALPLNVIESALPSEDAHSSQADDQPWIHGRRALGFPAGSPSVCPTLLIVRVDGQTAVLEVDSIDGPRELVVRPLGALLGGHPAINGFSHTNTGEVVLTLNPAGLVRLGTGPTPSRGSDGTRLAGKPTALVIDDSISVRQHALRLLRDQGYHVEEAENGEQGLRLARSRAYRVILTDLEMPRMDGLELLAELRRTSESRRPPVIVASTCQDQEVRQRVLDLGASAFLAKPIDSEGLSAILARLFDEPPAAGVPS